jgi:hypothetical protein
VFLGAVCRESSAGLCRAVIRPFTVSTCARCCDVLHVQRWAIHHSAPKIRRHAIGAKFCGQEVLPGGRERSLEKMVQGTEVRRQSECVAREVVGSEGVHARRQSHTCRRVDVMSTGSAIGSRAVIRPTSFAVRVRVDASLRGFSHLSTDAVNALKNLVDAAFARWLAAITSELGRTTSVATGPSLRLLLASSLGVRDLRSGLHEHVLSSQKDRSLARDCWRSATRLWAGAWKKQAPPSTY